LNLDAANCDYGNPGGGAMSNHLGHTLAAGLMVSLGAAAMLAQPTRALAAYGMSPPPANEWRVCTVDGAGSPQQRLAACAAVITRGGYTPQQLIDAYINRGIVFNDKLRDYNSAIQEYSQALRMDPNNANAFSARGSSLLSKGLYDRAIQDLNRAIALGGDAVHRSFAFNVRGLALLDKAQSDFDA
jgi:tetratricopeptide (TPR) repeat protein